MGSSASPPPAPGKAFQIGFPAPAAAEDAALVRHLVDVVNAVYTKDEEGIWIPDKPFARTDDDQIRNYLAKGELALAWASSSSTSSSLEEAAITSTPPAPEGFIPEPATVMGCIHLHRPAPSEEASTSGARTVVEVGMLVCDPGHRGAGVGRELMRFAEAHARSEGAAATQVELLFPEGWEHPFKMRLQAWYERLGYRLVRMGEVRDKYPQLVDSLAGPTRFKVSEKEL